MGRIIFDPKAFAPQYVAPRREPGERSKLDAFLTPSGLVTSATLLKMLGGLRLPAGLRDQGVDASAMAMKEAAKARASAKDSFQKQQQIFDAEKQKYMQPDRDVLTRETQGMTPELLAQLREQSQMQAREQANQAFRSGDIEKAKRILQQTDDRIGLTSLNMTEGERLRRQSQAGRLDQDRLSRMAMPGELPLSQRPGDTPQAAAKRKADKGLNFLPKTFKELGKEAMAVDVASALPGQDVMAEAVRLAKEGAPTREQTVGVPGQEPLTFDFMGIKLDDLQDDGSDRIKSMTRSQVRDLLTDWKEGGKVAALKAAAATGQDVAEVNALEEQLHRHLRMKARQERPKFSVEEPPDYVEQEEMVNLVGTEAAERFMQARRAEDPYFGMRPDDAIAQIAIDATSANTEEKQARIKAAIAGYTPRAVTFGDLFVDSRKERMMQNLANVEKLFPKIKEAKSAVDLLKERDAQAELDRPYEESAAGIKRRQAKASLDKTLRSMKRDRGSKNYGKTLDKIRRDVKTIAYADHNVESQKQKVSQLKVFIINGNIIILQKSI